MSLLVRSQWRRPLPADPSLGALRQAILPIALIAVATLFLITIDELINLTGSVYQVSEGAGRILRTLGMAWLAVLACNIAAELIIKSPAILPNSLDAHLLRAAFRVLGLALGVILLSRTATALGLPLLGVLAGLGVGGLALALAAQPTIENFIGGVILYADRPVRTGDFCRCGDVMGTVEEIGIRSTRIRALDRTLVSIPNAEFAKSRIVNFTRRDYHLFETTIGVRFETTPADIERLLERLRTMLEAHPLVRRETLRVRFSAIAESSLNIDFWVHILTDDYRKFLIEKENLLLSIMGLVAESGCTFAFPSRTVYLSGDPTQRPQVQSGTTDGEDADITAAIAAPRTPA
jgi:MscS family membrane protein